MAYVPESIGHDIGKSLTKRFARLQEGACRQKAGVKFIALDNIAADAFDNDAKTQIVGNIPLAGWHLISVKTVAYMRQEIDANHRLEWWMGCFEMPKFAARWVSAKPWRIAPLCIIGGGGLSAP